MSVLLGIFHIIPQLRHFNECIRTNENKLNQARGGGGEGNLTQYLPTGGI